MSTEPFIGEIKVLGFTFPPLGYQLCAGQLMSIAQYTALFSLLGTTYGGDGQTTFALPDIQGRVPVGQGQGPGLPDYTMGEAAGSYQVSLNSGNLPAHVHTVNNLRVQLKASTDTADENTVQNTFPANAGTNIYSAAPTAGVYTGGAVVSGSTDPSGSSMPIGLMNPYLVLNYSIALEGIFPSRN